MSLAQHTMTTGRWLTPKPIVDRCISVLGPIDIDPASEVEANKRIGAAVYYNEMEDGLSKDWSGTLLINPPGGKRDGKSLPFLFWKKLIESRAVITHAIFVLYSLEQLQSFQNKNVTPPSGFPICIPNRRIRYDRPDGTPGDSPTHSSALVYIPGRSNRTQAFVEQFSSIGAILAPM